MLTKEFTVVHSDNWQKTINSKSNKKYSDFSFEEGGKRASLSEGRNYGFASTLAKRKDNKFISYCPLTCCKDFVSDLVYSEITGKEYNIYGLKSYKYGLFADGVGYLIFGIEKQGRELVEYTNYKRDYEMLASNYKNLQKFINWFEKEFKVESLTEIKQIGENRYVATFPLFWADGTYLISLYGLLLRVGMFYKNEDVMAYLKDFKHDSGDAMMINTVMNKIERMLKGEIPKQDLGSCHSPHSIGISGFSFK